MSTYGAFTCQALRHALRQKTGLRMVYLHFRQTQAALPRVYGAIFEKICSIGELLASLNMIHFGKTVFAYRFEKQIHIIFYFTKTTLEIECGYFLSQRARAMEKTESKGESER